MSWRGEQDQASMTLSGGQVRVLNTPAWALGAAVSAECIHEVVPQQPKHVCCLSGQNAWCLHGCASASQLR